MNPSPSPQFHSAQIHDAPLPDGGLRVLVDRLWPRGVSKERAALDHWAKDVTPSTELRQWFHAHPDQTEEFGERYRAELAANPTAVDELRGLGPVMTLLSARANAEHVKVLLEILPER